MAAEASLRNSTLLIIVPVIGLVVLLYYSGLSGDVTYYVNELLYFIGKVIPGFIGRALGLS